MAVVGVMSQGVGDAAGHARGQLLSRLVSTGCAGCITGLVRLKVARRRARLSPTSCAAIRQQRPMRRRERQMHGFRDPRRTQHFLSCFGPLRQHFALPRHTMRAGDHRA